MILECVMMYHYKTSKHYRSTVPQLQHDNSINCEYMYSAPTHTTMPAYIDRTTLYDKQSVCENCYDK